LIFDWHKKLDNIVIYFNFLLQKFFFGYAGSGSEQSVLIWTDPESKETVLCPLGWK